MKILHLRLENFRGIRELDVDFNGKNADVFGANGTGKTTIANAVTWLFCDAPATEEKDFSPKTAGAHDLHHKAEMTVAKDDGERFTFAKDYYEKWTKKRGSASREFSGHVTDWYVNGVQQKKKTYEETIQQATGATIEQMKMLLLHGYFPQTMKPEARRTVLFELCEEVSDEDVIRENGLEGLSGVLLRPGTTDEHYSVDEYKKVAAAQRRKLNKELDTLPARIDEASKALPEDGRELAAIEADLKTAQGALDQAMAATAEAKHPKGAEVAKAVLAGKQADLEAKRAAYDTETAKANAAAYDAVGQAKRERDEHERAATKAAEEAKRLRGEIGSLKAKRDALLKEYAEVQAEVWGEAQETCPTCGQHLPEDKIAEFRQSFNERKSRLDICVRRGSHIIHLVCDYGIEVVISDNSRRRSGSRVYAVECSQVETAGKLLSRSFRELFQYRQLVFFRAVQELIGYTCTIFKFDRNDCLSRDSSAAVGLRTVLSNDIRFLGICLNLLAVVTLAIIAFNALLRLGNIDFSLNMFFRSIKQIFRGFQSVNVLQADCSSPSIASFCLCRLALPDIRFKLILPILFSHLTTS